jgi:hypothetical protein
VENSFALRRTIASQEEVRIGATEKAGASKRSFRGIRTIYHDEFPPYFNWVVAKIPLVQRHDTFDLHLNCYGIPLKLYELEAYLEELLGQKFESLFGFAAGRAEYQYLDDVLAMGLDKLGAETENAGIDWLNLGRVRAWLAEHIIQAKTASVVHTDTCGLADELPLDTQAQQLPPSDSNAEIGYNEAVKGNTVSVPEAAHFSEQMELAASEAHIGADSGGVSILAASSTSTVLKSIDDILAPGFTLDKLDRLAHRVKLVNEEGVYHLGPRKLGAIVGFCSALKEDEKLYGTIPQLTAIIGPHFGAAVSTRDKGTDIAKQFYKVTGKALRDEKR